MIVPNWRDQIKIEPITENTGDLFIANCARVSHDKWKTEFDDNDQKLLNFLARSEPEHKTPFRHPRHTFHLAYTRKHLREWLQYIVVSEPFLGAGIILRGESCSMSILSMVQLIKRKRDGEEPIFFLESLTKFLREQYPGVFKAFNLLEETDHYGFIDMKAIKPTERWMKNVSFRCTAPIWMTRQLVKHAVMMAWNEVSRRYVSSIPEMFAQELRLKAENVKQGSGGVARHVPDVYCENDNHSGWFDVNDINDAMLRWYEAGVNPDGECHLAPETVRGFLPLNMMTTWIWSGPVPTFDHVVRLRDEAHSQKETQDFGKKLKAVL